VRLFAKTQKRLLVSSTSRSTPPRVLVGPAVQAELGGPPRKARDVTPVDRRLDAGHEVLDQLPVLQPNRAPPQCRAPQIPGRQTRVETAPAPTPTHLHRFSGRPLGRRVGRSGGSGQRGPAASPKARTVSGRSAGVVPSSESRNPASQARARTTPSSTDTTADDTSASTHTSNIRQSSMSASRCAPSALAGGALETASLALTRSREHVQQLAKSLAGSVVRPVLVSVDLRADIRSQRG